MPTSKFTAAMATYDNRLAWQPGECSQGDGTLGALGNARYGLMYFKGLGALKGKLVKSVTLTFTLVGGSSSGKTLRFYRSKISGVSTAGKTGDDYRGATIIGEIPGLGCATYTRDVTKIMGAQIAAPAAGSVNDTFVIYSNKAEDFTGVRNITLSAAWDEPYEKSSVNAPSSMELGAASKITVTRAAGGTNSTNLHTLVWKAGAVSGTIATKTSSIQISFSPPFTATPANSRSIAATLTCKTYTAGGSYVGESSVSTKLVLTDGMARPICILGAVTSSPVFFNNPSLFIVGKSKVLVPYTVKGLYGASITEAVIGLRPGAATASDTVLSAPSTGKSAAVGPVKKTGLYTVVLKTKDSRGVVSEIVKSNALTAYDYKAPAVSVTGRTRSADGGAITVNVNVGAQYLTDFGNEYTQKIYYRSKGAPSFTSVAFTGNTCTVSGLEPKLSYEVFLSCEDKLQRTDTGRYEFPAKTAVPFDFRWNGASIGKPCEEENLFDIAYPTRLLGGMRPIEVSDKGEDLNSEKYRIGGRWFFYTAAEVANAPGTVGFLETFPIITATCYQVWHSVNNGETWTRKLYVNAWSPWKRQVNTDEIEGFIGTNEMKGFVKAGAVSITPVNTTGVNKFEVTFPEPFPFIPSVTLCPRIADPTILWVSTGTPNVNGFGIYYKKNTSASFIVEWQAIRRMGG